MMTNELYHHGIKGQKWGVRRYQNLDRSLTPAGKERYGRGTGEKIKSAVKTVGREVANAGKAVGRGISATGRAVGNAGRAVGSKINESYKKKHPNKMSDAELKAYISRLQMEKQVKQLKADLNPEKEHKIRKRIAGIMDQGIDTITKRAWNEAADKIFETEDKRLEKAVKRQENAAKLEKASYDSQVWDSSKIDTSKMNRQQHESYLAWAKSEKAASEAKKETLKREQIRAEDARIDAAQRKRYSKWLKDNSVFNQKVR